MIDSVGSPTTPQRGKQAGMWEGKIGSWKYTKRLDEDRNYVDARDHISPRVSPIWNMPLDRLVIATIATFPFWYIFAWLSGLTLFSVLAVSLVGVFALQKPTKLEVAVLATAAFLALGIVVAMLLGTTEGRASSSIYHIIHWAFFLTFIQYGARLSEMPDRDVWLATLSKAAFLSFVIMMVYMLIAAWFVSSNPTPIQFPTLVTGYIAGGIDMLSGYKFINVSKINPALGETEWRLIGFGLWTSEGAYIAVILGLLAIPFALSRFGMQTIILIEISILIAITFTGSRTLLLAFILSIFFWALLYSQYWRVFLISSAPVFLFCILFFFLGGHALLFDAIRQWTEARAESSGTRFISYLTAWEMTLSHNPLTGLGFTPLRPNLIHVPVGSHSSWTSVFIRGGFLAVISFTFIHLLLFGRILKLSISVFQDAAKGRIENNFYTIILFRAVFITLTSWFTEDLDGPTAGIAFAGLVIGLLWGWNVTIAEPKPVTSIISRWR